MTVKNMALRDELALERTYLAKERTILAYVRTGLSLIGIAAFIYKFIEMSPLYKTAITLALGLPGVVVTAYGLYKTILYRRERKKIQRVSLSKK